VHIRRDRLQVVVCLFGAQVACAQDEMDLSWDLCETLRGSGARRRAGASERSFSLFFFFENSPKRETTHAPGGP
jgi:hypothetical protein